MSIQRLRAGGTLGDLDLYVERSADRELLDNLDHGEYCMVFAPRQMGKSSLRHRTARELTKKGCLCITVDLTAIAMTHETDKHEWCYAFTYEIERQLSDGALNVDDYFDNNKNLSPIHKLIVFLKDLVKKHQGKKIVLFIDEIDAVQVLPFGMDEFFAAIRSLYNDRAQNLQLQDLTLCFLGVVLPQDLVSTPEITPFNIGRSIELTDFTRGELKALASSLSSITEDPAAMLDMVYEWTSGHPFMTQRLCMALMDALKSSGRDAKASSTNYQAQVDRLVRNLFIAPELSADYSLQYAKNYLGGRTKNEHIKNRIPRMLSLYREILQNKEIVFNRGDEVQEALLLSGVVAARSDGPQWLLQPRSLIFRTVLDIEWLGSKLELRKLDGRVQEWIRHNRDEHYLLHGRELREVEEWAEKQRDLTENELEFLRNGRELERKKSIIRLGATISSAIIAAILMAVMIFLLNEQSKQKTYLLALEHERDIKEQALQKKTEQLIAETIQHQSQMKILKNQEGDLNKQIKNLKIEQSTLTNERNKILDERNKMLIDLNNLKSCPADLNAKKLEIISLTEQKQKLEASAMSAANSAAKLRRETDRKLSLCRRFAIGVNEKMNRIITDFLNYNSSSTVPKAVQGRALLDNLREIQRNASGFDPKKKSKR